MRTATAVGLFYCSEDELASVRRHLPQSATVALYADDGSDAACNFAVIGSAAAKRPAALKKLRAELRSTPAAVLSGLDDDVPPAATDFLVLAHSELHQLP